jgi:hypothetical protein
VVAGGGRLIALRNREALWLTVRQSAGLDRREGTCMRTFELEDVIALLQREVDKAGGQRRWSERTGVDRTLLNQVLRRRKQPSARIIAALGLRVVFARGGSSWPRRMPASITSMSRRKTRL